MLIISKTRLGEALTGAVASQECAVDPTSDEPGPYKLKKSCNYYYQVQCQLFCDQKDWCDFVANKEKDFHVQRIYFDEKWWGDPLPR